MSFLYLPELASRGYAGSDAATMHSEDGVKLFIGSLHSRDLNMAASIAKVAARIQTVPKKGPGGGADSDLVAAGEAAIERGVLLFKLLGNLHAPCDYLPDVRPLPYSVLRTASSCCLACRILRKHQSAAGYSICLSGTLFLRRNGIFILSIEQNKSQCNPTPKSMSLQMQKSRENCGNIHHEHSGERPA
jgi:hypothetical protein